VISRHAGVDQASTFRLSAQGRQKRRLPTPMRQFPLGISGLAAHE
jgi:hypothetical protein